MTRRVALTGLNVITGQDFIIKSAVLLPTLNPIANPDVLVEDDDVQVIDFTGVARGRAGALPLKITTASDHSEIIAIAADAVQYVEGSGVGTVKFTPQPDVNGKVVITVSVRDPGADGSFATAADDGVFSRSFTVTVKAVNDPPTFVIPASISVAQNAGAQSVTNFVTGIGRGGGGDEASQTLSAFTITTDTSFFTVQPAISSTGTLTYTPNPSKSGTVPVTVKLSDDGGKAGGGSNTTSRTFDLNLLAPNTYSIEATSAVKPEGQSTTTPTTYTFTVTRSGPANGISTVNYSVTGSATNPATAADFLGNVLPSGTVVFAAGVTSQVVTINVLGEAAFETDEGFVVTLNSPSAPGTITTASANGTIQNDDVAPTVALSRSSGSILEAGGKSIFTAVLSAPSYLPVTVVLGFTGNPTLTTDYTRIGSQIVIAAGAVSGAVTVTAVQDSMDEVNETVIVDITGVTNAIESLAQQATTTINDDDAPPTVTLSRSSGSINEAAGSSTFTAVLSAASSFPVTIDLGFTGTATLTSDYTRSATQIVIPAGQTSGTIMVTAVQDLVDEVNETVIVDILAVTNGTESGVQQASTIIMDDDNPPTVTLSVNSASINEAAGSAVFTALLSAPSSLTVTITLGFTGTAGLTSDYTRSSTQIVIVAGQTSGTVSVTAVQDAIDETERDRDRGHHQRDQRTGIRYPAIDYHDPRRRSAVRVDQLSPTVPASIQTKHAKQLETTVLQNSCETVGDNCFT